MGSTIKMFGNVDKASREVMGTSGSQTGITGYAFGLIGIAGGGDVKVSNINFVYLAINYADGNMVAAVIGFAPSNLKFHDDGAKVTDKWSDNDTIGKDDVTISNITVSGSIIAKQDVAGIIGKAYNEGNVTITNCINIAKIEQTNSESGRASGILAYASGQT